MTTTLSIQENVNAPDQAPRDATGGRLVATDSRTLPLVAVRLATEAKGGLARSRLVQLFENPFEEPLQVTYLLPLPHGGAVSGFSLRFGDRRIVGEVDAREKARERFEEAVLSGRTAALLEEARGSLFSQELGNVPPGARIEAELVVDQKLDWLLEGAWEWRFPTAVAPRYQGAQGRVADAAKTLVDVADGPTPPRLSLNLIVRDPLSKGRRPESPSHAIWFSEEGHLLHAALEEGSLANLDRDVVIRWPVATPEVGVTLDAHLASERRLLGRALGLLTVVPPDRHHRLPAVPCDLVLLLDVSGSMAGAPLAQARRVAQALVDSLGEEDQLEMIAFGSSAVRWRRGPAFATPPTRKDAQVWLSRLTASGGTEMREGIREALLPLRPNAQRQVVLFTDGLIGFESEVVAEIKKTLPENSRVHTVGVGSAVNRSLTGPAARAGRGLEVVIGLSEDPERAAAALSARTDAPQVIQLSILGDGLVAHAPERLPDLYAGAPVLVPLELSPEGGTLLVRGSTTSGPFERRLTVARASSLDVNPAPGEARARERAPRRSSKRPPWQTRHFRRAPRQKSPSPRPSPRSASPRGGARLPLACSCWNSRRNPPSGTMRPPPSSRSRSPTDPAPWPQSTPRQPPPLPSSPLA